MKHSCKTELTEFLAWNLTDKLKLYHLHLLFTLIKQFENLFHFFFSWPQVGQSVRQGWQQGRSGQSDMSWQFGLFFYQMLVIAARIWEIGNGSV